MVAIILGIVEAFVGGFLVNPLGGSIIGFNAWSILVATRARAYCR